MKAYSSTGAIHISRERTSTILVDLAKGHSDCAIICTGRQSAGRACTHSSSNTSLWWALGLGATSTKKTSNTSCASIAASAASASPTEQATKSA
jgi:hypothetical protein